jgi:HemY protein
MGRLFIVGLLALLAGVGIVALIETEPGYLLIAYGGYTVETSFWVGIVLIATRGAVALRAAAFPAPPASSPASVLNWAGARRLRQSARLSSRGQISFIEGNWRARKQLLRGARYSESPLLNYLMAARASYRLQEPEAMREYLAAGGGFSDIDASIAVELTQAELQLQAQQYEEASTTLSGPASMRSRIPTCCTSFARLYEGLGDIEAHGGADARAARHPCARWHRAR